MHSRTLRRGLTALALAGGTLLAAATPTSFSGTFAGDDERATSSFTLTGTSLLKIGTLSWGGGGAVAPGGFAPVLSLFDAGGALVGLDVGSAHVCGAGSGAADPATGFCWDALLSTTLSAGSYTLVLTQDGNTPLGALLGDGFAMDGQADYTGWSYLGEGGHRFINVDGSQRDGDWAYLLDSTLIDTGPGLPEPPVWALMLMAAIAWLARVPPTARRAPAIDDAFNETLVPAGELS